MEETHEAKEVSILQYIDTSDYTEYFTSVRTPLVLRGCPLGPCSHLWSADYLADKLSDHVSSVHVATQPNMDFLTKNFTYQNMRMDSMIRTAANSTDQFLYLRSVSGEVRSRTADLNQDYPSIAPDFVPPPGLIPLDREFSRVLRVSSGGVRVWTHYDVMDNIYCQVLGHKQAVLWPPDQADKLYLSGDKSSVLDIDHPDLEIFPNFPSAKKMKVDLEPGDILFIPALWFHNMLAQDFGVAVNVFWKELDDEMYDGKDLYGNKDHVVAARAMRTVDNMVKQLENLPPVYRDFYARKLADRLRQKCCL